MGNGTKGIPPYPRSRIPTCSFVLQKKPEVAEISLHLPTRLNFVMVKRIKIELARPKFMGRGRGRARQRGVGRCKTAPLPSTSNHMPWPRMSQPPSCLSGSSISPPDAMLALTAESANGYFGTSVHQKSSMLAIAFFCNSLRTAVPRCQVHRLFYR